jgi:hypothetical protein
MKPAVVVLCFLATSVQACGLWVGNPKPKPAPQGGDTPTLALPLVTPPVRAATPKALRDVADAAPGLSLTLPAADFKSRFFGSGPTSIFAILESIDERLSGYNARSAGTAFDCLQQEPVAYIMAPLGQEVTFYAQCYELLSDAGDADPKLIQFGQKDGKTYLYMAVGQRRAAVIATPVAGGDAYQVQAWLGVGYLNDATCGTSGTFDGCSYGLIELEADASRASFEMAVAGIGFGYCGAQLRSDGQAVFGEGSLDGPECSAGHLVSLGRRFDDAGDMRRDRHVRFAADRPRGRHRGDGA